MARAFRIRRGGGSGGCGLLFRSAFFVLWLSDILHSNPTHAGEPIVRLSSGIG
jgi:hypothetical protein